MNQEEEKIIEDFDKTFPVEWKPQNDHRLTLIRDWLRSTLTSYRASIERETLATIQKEIQKWGVIKGVVPQAPEKKERPQPPGLGDTMTPEQVERVFELLEKKELFNLENDFIH